MNFPEKCCRLCSLETDFNIPLFSNYCQRTKMLEKIFVCLKISITDQDRRSLICYKCATNVEKYYEFISCITDAQIHRKNNGIKFSPNNNNKRVKIDLSNVESSVKDTFFDDPEMLSLFVKSQRNEILDKSNSRCFSFASSTKFNDSFENEPGEVQAVRPLKQDTNGLYKFGAMQQPVINDQLQDQRQSRHHVHSLDIFDSQSEDVTQSQLRSEWKINPDKNIIKKIRDECFSHLNFS